MKKLDFVCIIYSNHADDPSVIKKDEIAPQKIISCAENFHNGGGPESLCRHKIPRTAGTC